MILFTVITLKATNLNMRIFHTRPIRNTTVINYLPKFLHLYNSPGQNGKHTGWRERNQQDATNPMFIIKLLSQHVSGITMPETCCDKSLIINIGLVASCWFLSLHPTFMMHGHTSLKLVNTQYCKGGKKKKSTLGLNLAFMLQHWVLPLSN